MGSLTQRIAALKAAHPNYDDSSHPLRLRISEQEALELVDHVAPRARQDAEGNEVAAPEVEKIFQGVVLNDVGTNPDDTPKPTLHESADALQEFLKKPHPDPSRATHSAMREWVQGKDKHLRDLWEHIEGVKVDGVELVGER